MKTNIKHLVVVAVMCLLLPGFAISAEEPIYGSQLMTAQERQKHRTKMMNLKTEEERIQYRQEHHKLMQERAKQQGVILPDMPKQSGMGMGNKMGGDTGKGSGKGK